MVTYILGDKNNPIDLGLFQTIVKIDFPSNGDYVRYTVSAQSGKNNIVTPNDRVPDAPIRMASALSSNTKSSPAFTK